MGKGGVAQGHAVFVAQDGFTWHMSPTPPYGTQIKLSSGETITVSTRERPKMFFDESGQMTHLFSARGSFLCVCCPSLTLLLRRRRVLDARLPAAQRPQDGLRRLQVQGLGLHAGRATGRVSCVGATSAAQKL